MISSKLTSYSKESNWFHWMVTCNFSILLALNVSQSVHKCFCMGILYFCTYPDISGSRFQFFSGQYVQPNDFVNSLWWFLQANNCNLVWMYSTSERIPQVPRPSWHPTEAWPGGSCIIRHTIQLMNASRSAICLKFNLMVKPVIEELVLASCLSMFIHVLLFKTFQNLYVCHSSTSPHLCRRMHWQHHMLLKVTRSSSLMDNHGDCFKSSMICSGTFLERYAL